MQTHKKAFTLIEILVVISILAILATLLVTGIAKARRSSNIKATQLFLQELASAIENYYFDFHQYPPSSLQNIGVEVDNQLNLGNESLVACLWTQQKKGPYFRFDEKKNALKNYDADTIPNFNHSINQTGQAYEVVDLWKNPLVYIKSTDYIRYQPFSQYKTKNGKTFSIQPARNKKTKNYFNIGKYQLWSIGPNGINENGNGDDIPIWSKK